MARTEISRAPAPPAQPTGPRYPRREAPRQPAAAPTLIGSVQRAVRLLEVTSRHRQGAPAKQLAREAGLALPTAYHLLRTLVHEGYLERDQGMFVLGSAAERLSAGAAVQGRRTRLREVLGECSELLGVPLYFALYREGEVELVCVASGPGREAIEESAPFRATAHAHALGQCLLSQLDEAQRLDHLDRYPVRPLTPWTVRDAGALLDRLERVPRLQPVTERQEYVNGTVCAALPVSAGSTAGALAFSLPLDQQRRLVPVARRLQSELTRVLGSVALSISI